MLVQSGGNDGRNYNRGSGCHFDFGWLVDDRNGCARGSGKHDARLNLENQNKMSYTEYYLSHYSVR